MSRHRHEFVSVNQRRRTAPHLDADARPSRLPCLVRAESRIIYELRHPTFSLTLGLLAGNSCGPVPNRPRTHGTSTRTLLIVALLWVTPAFARCGDQSGDLDAVATVRGRAALQCDCASAFSHSSY